MKIAQRIIYNLLENDESYNLVADFLERHRASVDEITLFTGYCHHGAIPLETLRPQAAILARRIEDLHKRGFKSVGLNVHTTLGHIDEAFLRYGQPFTPIMGYRGDESKACFCPVHEDMKQFLRDKYTMYAETKPDFMWVDDDVKFFWNGVKFGCFCPVCMERFNKKMGTNYTREELVAAMEQPDAIELRAAWVHDIDDRIAELFTMIRETVDKVDPSIEMGFQTQHQGWSSYNGMNFERWLPILGNKGRPGEGFYFETTPKDVCTKALSTARQAAGYPASVTDVQYELEDFPNYSVLQKSVKLNMAELTLAIAQGMNGLLLNNFQTHAKTAVWEMENFYNTLSRNRICWDKMEFFARGMRGSGFYPAISREYDARRPLHNGQSFFTTYEVAENHNVMKTYKLGHLGIPLTVDEKNTDCAIFTGDLPDGFTDEELLGFLKKAVLMDAPAARAFERRGLGKYLGVRCVEDRDDSIMERFVDNDPINEGFEGFVLDVRPAFYGGVGTIMETTDPKTRVISELVDPEGAYQGVATSLYENELGGRVCVMGYGAFQSVDSQGRLFQMRRVAEYLTFGKQQTRFVDSCLAQQFVRTDGKRTMATVINLSLDNMEEIRFEIRGAKKAVLLKNGVETKITAEECGEYGRFVLPVLEPFATCTLLAE